MNICYICRDICAFESNYCNCIGNYKYVHLKCINNWILIGNNKCQICGEKYRLTFWIRLRMEINIIQNEIKKIFEKSMIFDECNYWTQHTHLFSEY
jgi:hypothetical protein